MANSNLVTREHHSILFLFNAQFIKNSNEKNVLSLKFILTIDVLIFNSNQKFQNKFKCKAFYPAQNRIRCIEHLKRRLAIVINELNNKQI